MKKRIFSSILLIALCVVCFGLAGCKKTPCQLESYKAVNDPLITGVANLAGFEDYDDETYAVWFNAPDYYEAGNYRTNFNLRYWPSAVIFPENPEDLPGGVDNYYTVFKKDSAGFYIILKKGKTTLEPLIKKGRNYWSFFTETFGEFICSETENIRLKDVIQYCLCFDPSKL